MHTGFLGCLESSNPYPKNISDPPIYIPISDAWHYQTIRHFLSSGTIENLEEKLLQDHAAVRYP